MQKYHAPIAVGTNLAALVCGALAGALGVLVWVGGLHWVWAACY
jgi:hypothetical protein